MAVLVHPEEQSYPRISLGFLGCTRTLVWDKIRDPVRNIEWPTKRDEEVDHRNERLWGRHRQYCLQNRDMLRTAAGLEVFNPEKGKGKEQKVQLCCHVPEGARESTSRVAKTWSRDEREIHEAFRRDWEIGSWRRWLPGVFDWVNCVNIHRPWFSIWSDCQCAVRRLLFEMPCNISTTFAIPCLQPLTPFSPPIFTFDHTLNGNVSCRVVLPNRVVPMVWEFCSTCLWSTERWARMDAAFEASLGLYRCPITMKMLLRRMLRLWRDLRLEYWRTPETQFMASQPWPCTCSTIRILSGFKGNYANENDFYIPATLTLWFNVIYNNKIYYILFY